MRQVRRNPLAVGRKTVPHLRLVKAFFWAAFVAMVSLTSGAGALFVARASLGRTSLADPTLLTEWLIAMGQKMKTAQQTEVDPSSYQARR